MRKSGHASSREVPANYPNITAPTDTTTPDFNCPPNDATYSLLTGQLLNDEQKGRLSLSRVTHVSVDPTVPRTQDTPAKSDEDGESEESDPDRVIVNARNSTDADGLLNDDELVALFAGGCRLRSAYDEGLSRIQNSKVAVYGERGFLQSTQPGFHEPAYTSYTHYWKSVLGMSTCYQYRHNINGGNSDYIFYIPPQGQSLEITSLMAPHRNEDLVGGLPLGGVCASDHVSLAAELSWTGSQNTKKSSDSD